MKHIDIEVEYVHNKGFKTLCGRVVPAKDINHAHYYMSSEKRSDISWCDSCILLLFTKEPE